MRYTPQEESAIESIRRAFHVTFANWPLLALRVAENVALVILMIGGFVACFIPALLWLGVDLSRRPDPEALIDRLASNPLPLFLAICGALVLFGVVVALAVALHAFFNGAMFGIYRDAAREGAAVPVNRTVDPSFRRFTVEAFFAYGRLYWWRIFVVYNIVWGVYGVIVLLPLFPVAVSIVLGQEQPALLVAGCALLVIVLFVAIAGALIAGIWSVMASIIAVTDEVGGREAVRRTPPLIKARMGELILPVALRIGAGVGIEIGVSGFYFGVGAVSSIPVIGVMVLPFHASVMLVHSIANVILSSWLFAALVIVALSSHRSLPHVARPADVPHG